MTEDENIIKNSLELYKKNPHEYIDYKKKICIKPWGYEFLCYESKKIGMWFLNINYELTDDLNYFQSKEIPKIAYEINSTKSER